MSDTLRRAVGHHSGCGTLPSSPRSSADGPCLDEHRLLCNARGVATVIHQRRATALSTALIICTIGCSTDAQPVRLPGADAVVTAPVVSVERPPDTAPATTPATTIGEPTPTEPSTTVATTTQPGPATAPPDTTAPPGPQEESADDVFLRLGDEGPEVASMQAKLASIDYISTDFQSGVFDEATRRGVRRFQGDYGLGVDGIFGPITLRALNAAVSSINAEN